MLLWVLSIYCTNPAFAQASPPYTSGDYRTAAGGTLSQTTGSASLERLSSTGTWEPVSYPLPLDANLYLSAPTQITGDLLLNRLIVSEGISALVTATGNLIVDQSLTVEAAAQLRLEGPVHSKGTLNLQVNSRLTIASPTYNSEYLLWAGTEVLDQTSEVRIENAQTNAVLFNPANLTVQNFGYWFGRLNVVSPSVTSNWQLVAAGGPVAQLATLQNAGSGSFLLAPMSATVNFGQELNLINGVFFLQNQTSGTVNVTVAGHTTLQNANLTLNQAASSASTYLNLKGNLTADATSSVNNASTVETSNSGINLVGNTYQEISIAGAVNHVAIAVKTGAMARLTRDLLLNPSNSVYASVLLVENGATLDFGLGNNYSGNNILGQGHFKTEQGSTLYITSPEGIHSVGNKGNVQVTDSRRSFHQVATFVFSGRVEQQTGTAFTTTSTGKIIIIDNPTSVTITQSTGISSSTTLSASGARLEIKQGKLIGTELADISGGGNLVMSGGIYQINLLNTIVPLLSGTYDITAGSVELTGNGNQTLRGKTYQSLIIGGDNTGTATSKNISTTTTVVHNLSILPDAILDISNKTLKGDGGLTMTGGLLRIAKLTTPSPELKGINAPYLLSGGTVEYYGSANSQNQSIRGTFGNSQKIMYHNLQLNAVEANTLNDKGNQLLSASFDISGTLSVNAPAVLQIASIRSIGGTGNFIVQPGATLLYGAPQGIKLSGTTTADGNVRVSGSRSFSSEADYGFIGNADMVSGDGLPATVANLLLAKTAFGVTLSQSVTVKGIFNQKSGLFNTGTHELSLANPATDALQIADSSFYVVGTLRRAMESSGLYSFPIGTVAGKRNLDINSIGLAGNGFQSLAVSFNALVHHQDTDLQIVENGNHYLSVLPEGVWHLSTNAQPSAGTYTAFASLSGFKNLVDNKFALLIRPLASTTGKDWKPGGGVLDAPNKDGRTVASGFAKRNFVGQFGQLGIASLETVLPVNWLYVNSSQKENTTILQWGTAQEMDNDRFEVEFSTNGKDFLLAGTIRGKGNSTTPQHYSYRFQNPTNKSTYLRVKQIDLDGAFEYSKVVIAQPVAASQPLELYPNPSQDVVYVRGLDMTLDAEIEIFDAQGKTMLRTIITSSAAPALQVGQLASGSYILQITQAGQQQRLRFLKL